MTALELLLRAAKAGIQLGVDDGRLWARHKGPLSPSWLARVKDNRAELIEELCLPLPPTPPFVFVDDGAALEDVLPRLREARRLALDTETSGLDAYTDRLLLVQLATDSGLVVLVDPLRVDVRRLAAAFAHRPQVVIFNASFDLAFLHAAGLELSECAVFDPLLAERVIDARGDRYPAGYHTLEAVVSRRLRQHLPKAMQLSDWSVRPLTSEQLEYAARDANVLLKLVDAQQRDIERDGLQRTVDLENDIVHQVVEMERNGVPLDIDRWTGRAEEAHAQHLRLRGELYATLGTEPPPLVVDGKPKARKAEVWDSIPQFLALLQSRGHDIADTTEGTLIALSLSEPLAALMLDYRKAGLRTRTFGLSYLDRYVRPDGRLHPHFQQTGAQTGRMSCRNPNVQQVPHSDEYRACFRPGEDLVWIKSDFGQVELRLIADRTGDPALIDCFQLGLDVHSMTAALIAGKPIDEVTSGERQRAKAINFGLSYGMGSIKLQAYAWQNYHVRLSLEESAELRKRFFETYRGIRSWHAEHHTPYGMEAAIDTYTPIGRRRREVLHLTEQLATPIQGAGGDAIKQALRECWRRRYQKPSSVRLLLTVHDELDAQAREDDADAARDWLHRCMEDGLQPLLERVPAVAETEIARSWAGAKADPVEQREVLTV